MVCLLLLGCREEKTQTLSFGICADYPPFEYFSAGTLQGFDIELGQLIAKELGKEASFVDMQFSSIPEAVHSGIVDGGLSAIAATPDRRENFDFSRSYYKDSFAIVYLKTAPIQDKAQLSQKKIACQLGSSMEMWLKKQIPSNSLVLVDTNNQAIEALKAGHIDGVLVNDMAAIFFAQATPSLSYTIIEQSNIGYSIMVKKGSKLAEEINNALIKLEQQGILKGLTQKWLTQKSSQ